MVHITKIRDKIEEDSKHPIYIKTVWEQDIKYEEVWKKLIVRLLIAIAISYLVAFGVLILVILSISYLYKINYLTDVSQGNANFRILIQFTAAILTFIAVFCYWCGKNIIFETHYGECSPYCQWKFRLDHQD
ncbi:helix-turn-helix domain-containing protein [Bacillus velezensis]|nr:helix-turn-helix domain-containing protein [Bacillus velezensis]